jgi:hypothetical protein
VILGIADGLNEGIGQGTGDGAVERVVAVLVVDPEVFLPYKMRRVHSSPLKWRYDLTIAMSQRPPPRRALR